MTGRRTRRLQALAAGIILYVLAGAGLAAAQVAALVPANGALDASTCGPFGVLLEPGALANTDGALVVRGSATGLRTAGSLTVSSAGDSLLFTPAVPFAPGETVTITLRGTLTRDGVPLGGGRVWTCRTAAAPARRAAGLASLEQTDVPLAGALAGGFEHLDWTWIDLDGDLARDGVLLAAAAGVPQLATVAPERDAQGATVWRSRTPAAVTADNPVAVLGVHLDDDGRGDLALLGLAGLQVWLGPGHAASPAGGAAAWLPFPAGFAGRALVAGDLDADGDQDLVVVGLFGSSYLVCLNDGVGALTPQGVVAATAAPPAAKAAPWPVRADLVDADGDGRLDLVWVADYQEGGRYPVRLAAGRGDGSFAPAGVLADREVFPRGLVCGQALDTAAAPQVLTALPDRGDANLCAVTFGGAFPGADAGCLTGPGLAAGAGPVRPGLLLADSPAPELWWADPADGTLTARPLDAGAPAVTRALGAGAAAVATGDLDFDGDADLVAVLPAAGRLAVLATPGGLSAAPPGPVGIACGGTYGFGTVELGCGEALGDLTFTNEGLRPARLEMITLSDATGAFRVLDPPTDWFGGGCGGGLATATLTLGFTPADTTAHQAALSLRIRWQGAAADGGDSLLACGAILTGRGGVFALEAGPAGPGALGRSGGGYAAAGGAFDLGLVPADTAAVDTVVTLTNTGGLAVDVTPPAAPAAPWSVDPVATRRLLPGETAAWTVRARPTADLLPAGVDTLRLAAELPWSVQPVEADVCFGGAVLRQRAALTLVRPVRPDLAVLDVQAAPLPGEDAIRAGRPFLVTAIVAARRAPAPGAVVTVAGAEVCGALPDTSLAIDLAEDRRDTVVFTVTPCGDALDVPVTVCIAPAGGMAFEFDPVDNCFTAAARLAPNAAPAIVFSDLGLDPADPGLASCDPAAPWNVLDAGAVAALGVREGGGLAVTATATDADGDPVRLELMAAPAYVSVVRVSDAEVRLTAAPPAGTVTADVCQLMGPVALAAFETAAARPETAGVAVPLWVKWEGPDLQAELVQVPASGELGRPVRFGGRVTNVGAAAMGPFEVTLWLTDDRDLWVAGRAIRVGGLQPGAGFNLPQVLYTPQLPGRHCARIAITEGRNLDPANDTAVRCLAVDAGPLVVSPNVVTPNGDGHNDRILFRLANQDVRAPRVRIYELSGALVYESARLDAARNLDWNGLDREGRRVPPGSYLWVIDDGGREVATGVCGVIR